MEINKEMKNAFGSNLQGSNNEEKKIASMIIVVVVLFFICNITETTAFLLGDKILQSSLLIFHFVFKCQFFGVRYFQHQISKNIPGTALLQKDK